MILASPAWAFFGSDCPDATKTPRPAWVSAGYKHAEAGFRYGFGEKRWHRKESYQKQLNEVLLRAREHLSSSIHIEVVSQTDLKSRLQENGSQTLSRTETDSSIRTRSEIELPGLPLFDSWQDADSCTLYALVRIDEPTVLLVQQRARANKRYENARSKDHPVRARLLAVDEAIALAEKYPFENIGDGAGSAALLNQFRQLRQELERLQSQFNHAVAVINRTGQGDVTAFVALEQPLNGTMSGSFRLPNQCTSVTSCLQLANQSAANFLSLADVQMNVVQQDGFWIGDFSVELSLWDLARNHQQFRSGTLSSRIMHRHQHKLTLEWALEKWLQEHAAKLGEFTRTAKKMGNGS
jgi:hypothetical protein